MAPHRNQKGAALVELALVLPLLLVMTFVVTEFGRALYQYNTITKGVRDAVRYLTTQTPNSGSAVTAARNLVVYGTTTAGSTPLARGLTTAMVNASWPAPTGTNPPIATVTVSVSGYAFQSIFATAFGLPFGTVPYSTITATMRVQA